MKLNTLGKLLRVKRVMHCASWSKDLGLLAMLKPYQGDLVPCGLVKHPVTVDERSEATPGVGLVWHRYVLVK